MSEVDTVIDVADYVDMKASDIWLVLAKTDKKKLFISGALILAGTALAAGTAAWQISKKRTEAKYEDILAYEIEQAKEFYARLNKRDEFVTPESTVQTLRPEVAAAADAIINYQSQSIREDEEEEGVEIETEVEVRNVFEQNVNYWDQEKEEAGRSPDAPYIVSYDEWMAGEYQQTQLTYYAGDEVLTDSKDEAIPLVDDVVGEENLRFGYGSGDSDTVFIRNHKMSLDFEVTRSTGRYDHEVLGLQHSDEMDREQRRRPVRKMRGGNE